MSFDDDLAKMTQAFKPVLDTFRDELLAEFRATRFEALRTEIRPGDTVVLKSAAWLSETEVSHIREQATEYFPDNRILILAHGLELHILGRDAP